MAAAARIVASVTDAGQSLDEALLEHAGQAESERAAMQALSFGTLRWWPRLERLLALLLDKPSDRTPPVIRALLATGLHQLEYSTHPAHAIVNETVEATRQLHAPRAAGLVNAVLRRYQREAATLRRRLDDDEVAASAHPQWLIDAIRADWPAQWQAILAANNRPAPLWLRVNRRKGSVEDYVARLGAAQIGASRSVVVPEAVALESSRAVQGLPGFESGDVSVQDAAAQFAASLLDSRPGMRILDACAAPGGKACHVLERTPGIGELVALDIAPRRLQRVRDNLERLGLSATLVAGDARDPQSWWDGRLFDRILVDAPCSGTGVIRRHPDIKVLRRPEDIDRMAAAQSDLLRAAWPLLATGGRLVYATCSVLVRENELVVRAFLRNEPAAVEVRPSIDGLAWGAALGTQILPDQDGLNGEQRMATEAGMDGFYYACLERRGI